MSVPPTHARKPANRLVSTINALPLDIRLATVDDAEGLAGLHKVCLPPGWPVRDFVQFCNSEISTVFVALHDRTICGVSVLRCVADEAEILTLAISPNVRKCGFGRKLLEATLQLAQAKAIRRVFLEVAVNNNDALALYEKFAFTVFAERVNYYAIEDGRREDAFVMVRTAQ